MSAFNQATPRFKSDENLPPLCTDETLQSTPSFTRTLKRFRSAPIESPLVELSTSFAELKSGLYRSDSFWNQITPGAVKFKKRKISNENMNKPKVGLLNLPTEVIDHIMSFLNKRDLLHFGAVNKHFYNISSAPNHWKSLNLTGKTILDTALHRILSRKTKTLAMMDSHIIYDNVLKINFLPLCSLTKADLSWARFAYPTMLTTILRRCTNLEYLGLQAQSLDFEDFTLIANNKNLKVLNICDCGVLSADGLSIIFKNCPLIEFNVSWCRFNDDIANVLINEMPTTIRRLSIAGTGNFQGFGDEGFNRLIDRLPHLIELDAGDNHEITTTFIQKLHDTAPNLRVLNISRCFNIDPIAYCMLTQLRVLNIYNTINAQGFSYLRSHMPNTIINETPFQTVAKSQPEKRDDILWNEPIADLY